MEKFYLWFFIIMKTILWIQNCIKEIGQGRFTNPSKVVFGLVIGCILHTFAFYCIFKF